MRSYRLPDLASPGGDSLLLGFLSGVADMVLDSSPEQQPEASSNVRLKNRGLKEQGLKPQETGEGTLTVPAEVEAAARVLVKHFDPDELYEAMVRARS